MDEPLVNQTLDQKKMAFANSEHIEAVITLLQECGGVAQLVGDTEFETVRNAITLDAQQDMTKKFIAAIDAIKKGSLFEPK